MRPSQGGFDVLGRPKPSMYFFMRSDSLTLQFAVSRSKRRFSENCWTAKKVPKLWLVAVLKPLLWKVSLGIKSSNRFDGLITNPRHLRSAWEASFTKKLSVLWLRYRFRSLLELKRTIVDGHWSALHTKLGPIAVEKYSKPVKSRKSDNDVKASQKLL